MVAVPSTIGRPARRQTLAPRDRLQLVCVDEIVLEGAPVQSTSRSPRALARRRLGTLAAVCGLVGLWLGTGALASTPGAAPLPLLRVAPGAVYVVRAGDTLESIAERLAPRREVPALVHAFADELHGGALRPGAVLRVP